MRNKWNERRPCWLRGRAVSLFRLRTVTGRTILFMAVSSTDRVRQHRARQRAALEADPEAARLRPADDLLAPAIEETLAALDLDGQDAAAAQLARQYARVIDRARDQAWAMRWLAPQLLEALTALNATPMARAKVKPASTGKQPPSWLDQMRQARPQRPI